MVSVTTPPMSEMEAQYCFGTPLGAILGEETHLTRLVAHTYQAHPGGRHVATVYDNMVHYGQAPAGYPKPPLTCPKCGSHRTEIVGRLDDGKTLVVRCKACGEHSTLLVGAGLLPRPAAASSFA